MSPEGPQPPMILLQQLLAAATQPSPVKAVFARQELEVPAPTALARPVCVFPSTGSFLLFPWGLCLGRRRDGLTPTLHPPWASSRDASALVVAAVGPCTAGESTGVRASLPMDSCRLSEATRCSLG